MKMFKNICPLYGILPIKTITLNLWKTQVKLLTLFTDRAFGTVSQNTFHDNHLRENHTISTTPTYERKTQSLVLFMRLYD